MNPLLSGALAAAAVLLAALLLLGSCGTPVKGKPFDPALPQFPVTKGENLNGRTFEIPSGFDGQYNILMVAFLRSQQEDVNTWLGLAQEIAADHPNVEYYELPTISSSWGLMKGWIDGGMRSGIPATAARERTVTIYTDTEAFRSIGGMDDRTRIWVGIVDRDGRIHWSTRGPATEEAKQQLREAARRLASPRP
ncbi:MAG: hypothetical protein RL689_86 [Planctomycetota bacterium]